MFRRSLSLSLIFPLLFLLILLMFAISFDLTLKESTMPEMRVVSILLVGLIVAWVPITFYFQMRRRILSPLRELRQKFLRATKDRLEPMSPPPARDEIWDVVTGYNQMAAALMTEREERQRYERERILQSQLVALGLQADGLVHELASPISTLSTLAKLAADGDAESAGLLAKESRALVERMRRFMALFKDRQVSVKPIGLGRLITDRVRLVNHGREAVHYAPLEDPLDILSDEVLVSEIVDNLLQNAARHCRSKVVVEAERVESAVCVTVTDDGGGILPQQAEKLFRPFFTTSEGGHGLGLFVSRLWAQALGGKLELAAARHPALGGASFRMTLPTGRHV